MNKKEYHQRYYQEHKVQIKDRSKQYRENHLDEVRARGRAYWHKHREKMLQHHRDYYQSHKEERKAYYEQNKERIIAKKHLERDKIKMEILTHYGNGKCACVRCGESRLACLSIDHIKGKGKEHRKQIGIIGGCRFYWWLKKQGFPEGYQVLCMNCQMIKKIENKEL